MSPSLNTLTATTLLLVLGLQTAPAVEETVLAAAFGVTADSGADATEGIRAAIEQCRRTGARRLVFAKGTYDLWPNRASERFLFVSNNDEGLKRIAFPLVDINGLEIDGGGASFIFHGPMTPFLIDHASHVAVRNLSFDFTRPFHSEAHVLAVDQGTVDVEFTAEFPYEVRKQVLLFTNGTAASGPDTTVKSGEVIYPYGSLLAFDPVLRETAFMAKDYWKVGNGIHAQDLGQRRVRLFLDKVHTKPGDTLVFGAAMRDNPGFVISDSSDVRLEGVSIHHCGGMGVIAQRSSDLFLTGVRVTPAPNGRRLVSVTADATHFVNCKGRIEMVDCLFENQKDDATNIHGLYARITRVLAPNRFEVRLVHPQQAGIDFIAAGTRLELTHGNSLVTAGTVQVEAVERCNKEFSVVTTREPLPAGVGESDCVADAEANTADVLIRNCVMRGNRARGVLLGSRGKTLVEGNTFHVPGAAILFEGDGRYWYEQAGVSEAVIRNNTFDTCNFGVWGKGCIEVGSGIAKDQRAVSRYNRNIRIEDNLFKTFRDCPLVLAYSVDGLDFHRNRITHVAAYGQQGQALAAPFEISDCDRVAMDPPSRQADDQPRHQ